MSFSTVEGTITAPNKQVLEKALDFARAEGWMVGNDLVAQRNVVSKNCVKGNTINLEYGLYFNIGGLLNWCKDSGLKVEIVGYTTDGHFEGFTSDKDFDLEAYAKENKLRKSPSSNASEEEHYSWMDEVGDHFMENTKKA